MSEIAAPLLSAVQQQALLAEKERLLEVNEQLRDELKELKRLLFGSKKERFVAAVDEKQLSLALGEEPTEPPLLLKETVHYERLVQQVTRKAARQLFPAHLPRVEIRIEPTEDVSGMRKVGEEITEELDRGGGPLEAGLSIRSPLHPSPLRQ